MRNIMQRALLVLIAAVFLMCAKGGLTIYAPDELAEATIIIDGQRVGQFQKTQRLYRWVGLSNMKKELSAPPRSETVAVLPAVAPGRHELKIEKAGYEPVITAFSYPAKASEIDLTNVELKRSVSP
jgi:hypothetical protein